MGVRVALLDAGAQLEKVIMRRVLEQGYEVDKFRADVDPSHVKDYDAIIISGGPRSVYEKDALLPDPGIYRMGKPILGICYGLQAIAHQLGGKVVTGTRGQYGRSNIKILRQKGLFQGLSVDERVLMSHFDTVEKLPNGFEVYAMSDGLIAAIGNEEKRIYAVQFHPELIPVTKHGQDMFENFFRRVCNFPVAEKRTIQQDIEYAKKLITKRLGKDKHVMHYLSGGVDSTVMAILLSQCVEPERLHIRTLDTGTMRSGEVTEVRKMAEELKLPNFRILYVRDRFYNTMREIQAKEGEALAVLCIKDRSYNTLREIQVKEGKFLAGPLCYTIDPEHKRRLFGTEYAIIALTEMHHIADEFNIPLENILLGQGTLRPDVIESGDKRVTKGEAHTIKTHHNAVEALKHIPKVEPLIELFKDQVRQIALELKLSQSFAYRQPFPGPGLYCRIIGAKNIEIEDSFFELDKRVGEEARKRGFYAHALPIRTVGVQGDERSYKHPVIVSGDIDWKEFAKFALDLPNEIKDINRVLYSPGKQITLEQAVSLTPTLMTHDAIKQSQNCDFFMRDVAKRYGFNDSRKCSQMPGILIPSNFGVKGNRSFVVRPVWTHDFMAIIGMMPYKGAPPSEDAEEFFPEEMFFEIAEKISKGVEGISRVILDASDKPPASTEWE